MRLRQLFFAALVLCVAGLAGAQAKLATDESAYTVIANPGENAASQMRISWHADSTFSATTQYCTYTKASDKQWKHAKRIAATAEMCTAFDSISSRNAKGEDWIEYPHFLHCKANLSKLSPGTEYMYRVGNSSQVRYFKTAPKKNDSWTAALISDFHAYTPLPKRTEAAMAMISTLERVNGADFDLVLHTGDITAWGGSYSFWKTLYEEPYFGKYAWAGVIGNHDNMDRTYKRSSNAFFRHANNYPENGYAGEEGVCYYFKYGNALFITLNNEVMRKDSALADAQKWVKEVITRNPAKYIIVMEHYQWFFANNGKTSQYARWHELFDEYGVDLALSGNNHIYASTKAIYQDKVTDGSRGTVYVQTPSSDNGRGRNLEEWTDNKDLIKFRWAEGPKTVGAMTVKADSKKLTLSLYDRYGNLHDTVTVNAKR